MTVRLTCGDGVIVRLRHEYFERAIFNNPEIAMARSYTLRCEANSDTLDAILDMADGEAETVTITEDNFEELKSLCNELGFRGLDKELRAFRGETGSASVDLQEFLRLKEHVTRQDKRFLELERQLNEVLSWKRKAESVSREFQSLERKVEEVARVCEERNVEASRKTEQALRECAKQRDLEELARDLAQLKDNEKGVRTESIARKPPSDTERATRPSELDKKTTANKALAKPGPARSTHVIESVNSRIEALEQEIEMLEMEKALVDEQISEEFAEGRKYMKAGQKAKAIECLKRKKILEGQLRKCASVMKELENKIEDELRALMQAFGADEKKAETPMDRIEVRSQDIEMLRKKKAFLEKKIADELAEAKKYAMASEQAKALECMKRKKSLEGQLAKYASIIKNLENRKDSLADAALSRDVGPLTEEDGEEVTAPSAPQRVPAAAVADDDEAEIGALMETFGV